jgi:alanine racemase
MQDISNVLSVLKINVANIVKNYKLVKDAVGEATNVAAVVKSDCYGLGVKKIVPELAKAGCNEFYVANVDEGIALRDVLKSERIFVLHGINKGEERYFLKHNLIPVLNNEHQVEIWEASAKALKEKLPASLNIDTGMTRLGMSLDQFEQIINDLKNKSLLDIIYIKTHLACANETSNKMNEDQFDKFKIIIKKYPGYKYSFANSPGFILGEKYWYDQVRVGAMLYGINPSDNKNFTVNPVVEVTSKIIKIYDITKEGTIGYGASYHLKPGMAIATMPVGYADGYFRSLSNKGHCYINGIKTPIIGNISMDLTTIDITNVPKRLRQIGQEIELIGKNISLETIASIANTISYEVLTSLGNRYRREYVY